VALNLVIEDGIPIPETTARQGKNIAFLKQMKPGQSTFFGPGDMKMANRFYRVAKKQGISIVIKKVEGGMRMWRVASEAVQEQQRIDELVVAQSRKAEPVVTSPILTRADKLTKKLNGRKLTEKQRREAKNAKDRERRAKKKADKEFGRNIA